MNNSFEIVFQNIAKSNLSGLLVSLVSKARKYAVIRTGENIDTINIDVLLQEVKLAISSAESDFCISIRLYDFKVTSDYMLSVVLLRIIGYDNQYDIDISFDSEEQTNADLFMLPLHKMAENLANKFKIKDFYGGIEPAIDEETRYFTNNELGPLAL